MKIFCQLSFLILSFTLAQSAMAKVRCSDMNAIMASDKVAESLLGGKVFKTGEVLKLNLPSYTKEVASYIYVKTDNLYYSVFTIVNTTCKARLIKRTTGKH